MSILNEIESTLKESSWSRIIQHIEDDDSFAVISAFLKNKDRQFNIGKHNQLRDDIVGKGYGHGYGYIEQDSGYNYRSKITGASIYSKELSFFVPNMKYNEAMSLAQKYNQESFLYKDNNLGFVLVYSKDDVDSDGKPFKIGDIGQGFNFKKDNSGKITFDPAVLKMAYSALMKANKSQKSKPFAYVATNTIKEAIIPSRADAMRGHNYVVWRNIEKKFYI
jgi:hypothetical protein